jgi:hypothetical protein
MKVAIEMIPVMSQGLYSPAAERLASQSLSCEAISGRHQKKRAPLRHYCDMTATRAKASRLEFQTVRRGDRSKRTRSAFRSVPRLERARERSGWAW